MIKSLALYGQVALTNRVATRIETELQIELYDHLIASDLARLSRETPAALTQRFTTDLGFVREALTRATSSLVRDVLTMLSVFAAMIWLDWKMSLIALLIAPLAVVPINVIGRRGAPGDQDDPGADGLMAASSPRASAPRASSRPTGSKAICAIVPRACSRPSAA